MEMPVLESSLSSAVSIGVVPRYLGNKEGWRLRMPRGKAEMTSSGMILPKEAKIPSWAWYWEIRGMISRDFSIKWMGICWDWATLIIWGVLRNF